MLWDIRPMYFIFKSTPFNILKPIIKSLNFKAMEEFMKSHKGFHMLALMKSLNIIFTLVKLQNGWLEDVFPTKIVLFWGHVSFQGCIPYLDAMVKHVKLQNGLGQTDGQLCPGHRTHLASWNNKSLWGIAGTLASLGRWKRVVCFGINYQ